jgi:hypothetical protein
MRSARGRRAIVAILVLAPLLVGASDPSGDLRPCRPSATGPGDPPDLIAGTGTVVEEGTSAEWTLRFAGPLVVPDRTGHPFRVDILIHDPTVPAVDVAYYHGLNRIVRYDAVPEQGVVILLLPERAQNVFLGGTVDGDTLTIQIPGRQITRDLDLEGVPIQDLTWTAVVRDGHRCDVLGSFRPHLPMVGAGVIVGAETPGTIPSATTSPPASAAPAVTDGTSGSATWWWLVVPSVLALVAWAYGRRRGRDSSR